MDYKDVLTRAGWTAVEAFLGTVVVFLAALALLWVEVGAIVMSQPALVTLAAGAVGALAAGITVIKEAIKARRANPTQA